MQPFVVCNTCEAGSATEPAITNVSRTDGRLLAAICKVIRNGKTSERQSLHFYQNPTLRPSAHLNKYRFTLPEILLCNR